MRFHFLIFILILSVQPLHSSEINSFSPIVKKVAPSIVSIYTEKKSKSKSSTIADDPIFNQFFGSQGNSYLEQSLGSGVIIEKEGIIITNEHVINDSQDIRVTLPDQREFSAHLIVSEKKTDIAILKIDDQSVDFPYAKMGNSDLLETGDRVIAIGNPFGIGQTVTSGIISAVSRNNSNISDHEFFLQTDAAINPGNSGGALVNMNAEVIGINTAILSKTGTNLGIGFAIPINRIRFLIENLRDTESGLKISYPWIGALVKTDSENNVVISKIYENSPASLSGLKNDDIVISVNNKKISDATEFNYLVERSKLGEKIKIKISREGKLQNFMVATVTPNAIPAGNLVTLEGYGKLSGVTFTNLSPAINAELGINVDASGVAVLFSNSENSLKRGDIVKSINETDIFSTGQFSDIFSNRNNIHWRIQVLRKNKHVDINISSGVTQVVYANENSD